MANVMEKLGKKSIWPLVWTIVKYVVTAIIGYVSNGTVL